MYAVWSDSNIGSSISLLNFISFGHVSLDFKVHNTAITYNYECALGYKTELRNRKHYCANLMFSLLKIKKFIK